MKSVKWSMFNMHFWCMSLDLTISLLTTPFILFPTISGYPMGLLEWFGVYVPTQIYFAVSLFAVVGIAVLGIFENRFYVLMAENTIWKYIRIPFFIINYLACLLFFIPPHLDIPNQDLARKVVLKKLSEHSSEPLPSWITDGPVFVLTIDATYSFASVFIMTITIVIEILFFIFSLKIYMKCLAKKMTLSKATLKMQHKFLNAIHAQMFTPLIILIAPLIYVACSIGFQIFNQAATNISFIMISLHGLASTIIMLLIHKPYRDACIALFRFKAHYRTTPVLESRRPSFVSHVAITG
ncbi:unnamed protein product [Caenorhabditis nigoni]